MTRGQAFSDNYRTVDENRILNILSLAGFAFAPDPIAARIESTQALDIWTDEGLAFRQDEAGQRLFDPVEVVCHLKTAGRLGRDDFWARHYTGTGRRLVAELEQSISADFRVTYNRYFNTAHAAPGKRLRLRIPMPLTSRCKALDIVPEIPPEAASYTLEDGRLEVRMETAVPDEIRVGAYINFSPGSMEDLAPPTFSDIYLRQKEGLIVISSRIAELAQYLAGSASPEVAVRAFWDYMLDQLTCVPLHYDQITVDAPLDWALETGCYDCQLGSALFIALCRSRGISARMVGGHMLYRQAPTNHYWAEVWIENRGWVPFDFLSWDLSLGGQDAQWRDHFFGRVDARLVTQCLPDAFTGALGLPIPQTWHILQAARGDGIDIEMTGLNGERVYKDQITILQT